MTNDNSHRLVIQPTQIKQEKIELTSQQQHYLLRVLRLKEGDRFIAMDGQGMSWWAKIEGASGYLQEVINTSTELPIKITLAVALPKGNSFEEIIRCCTELGVSVFLPIISDRTLLKPSQNKLERWRKIATEAAEQAERTIVPIITEPTFFNGLLNSRINTDHDCYLCVARDKLPHFGSYVQRYVKKNIVIATGPEGGWTDQEKVQAIALGWQPVSLGNRILRSVTAPIVALSLVIAAIESRGVGRREKDGAYKLPSQARKTAP
jgi:16S rRNA (uracil1498-N3)-methyltransferase